MKIGLMGGTFDPIHIVHLMVAESVRDSLNLDEVWFMPAHVPPHKEGRQLSAASIRLEMVRLAVEHIPFFDVSAFELEQEGPSYTINTIAALNQKYPMHEFYFIIGGDMMDYLPHWHRIDELIQMIQFVGVPRPGYVPTNAYATELVQMVPMPQMDISSTIIRERRSKGQTIRFLVPEAVRYYIEENHLYGP